MKRIFTIYAVIFLTACSVEEVSISDANNNAQTNTISDTANQIETNTSANTNSSTQTQTQVKTETQSETQTQSDIQTQSETQTNSEIATSTQTMTTIEPETLKVDFATGFEIVKNQCSNCHLGIHSAWDDLLTKTDWLNYTNDSDEPLINIDDPLNSLFLQRIKNYGGANSTMPWPNDRATEGFGELDYKQLQQWVVGLTEIDYLLPDSDQSVSFLQTSFNEFGLDFELACSADYDQVDIDIFDVKSQSVFILVDYLPVVSTSSGLQSVEVEQIAQINNDQSIKITGEGIGLWESDLNFNALQRNIDTNFFDVTLQINSVTNLNHEFAKIGLMVSSTEDMSGELVFVHWSGQNGLAEDSGEGALTNYQLLVENTDVTMQSELPAKVRIQYSDNLLKIGACINCENPQLVDPKEFNFKPKSIYIAANSNYEESLTADISVFAKYSADSNSVIGGALAQTTVNCDAGVAHVDLPLNTHIDAIAVHAKSDGIIRGSKVVKRSFSDAASCELQDGLLTPKLRRLSQSQLQNSIAAIFGDIFSQDIFPDLEDGAKLIGMNDTADKLAVNNLNFEKFYEFARAVTDTVLQDHESINSCALSSDTQCIEDIKTEYSLLIWRRPMSESEHLSLNEVLESLPDQEAKLEFLFNSLLLSSNFIFRDELGASDSTNNVNRLNNYELVSLLAFAVTNTTPDKTLLELAAQSTPLDAEQLKQQVTRLMQDENFEQAMLQMYSDYLKLDLVMTRSKEEQLNFNDSVRRDALASAKQMLQQNISDNLSFTDVFSGEQFFTNQNIDYLFGLSGNTNEFTQVNLSDQRNGVLNHPAFLSVHSTLSSSGIVKRGVFSLEQLLCQTLPAPPASVMPVEGAEDLDKENTSERELLLATHSSQAACVGCHVIIDPAGFGFENFDVIGRYRTTEKNNVLIDASGVLDTVGDHVLRYDNSLQYAQQIIESPQFNQCVSKRFLEHFIGQDLKDENCELKKFQQVVSGSDKSLVDLINALIGLESFSKRKLENE
ncbi:DUF1588 domain-containing protein [Marinicellulosiphila megalodicopiae]|uniref:DUF1588 domain-containing protein n=1 Tax=Marinicellulosiphila megalodicopiae TaxID=2724896 RepID=UPI003BAEFE0D